MSSLSFHKINAVLCAMLGGALLIVMMRLSLLALQPARAATNSQVLDYLYNISGTKTLSGQPTVSPTPILLVGPTGSTP